MEIDNDKVDEIIRRGARFFATGLLLKFHGWRKIAIALIDRLGSHARDNAMLAI